MTATDWRALCLRLLAEQPGCSRCGVPATFAEDRSPSYYSKEPRTYYCAEHAPKSAYWLRQGLIVRDILLAKEAKDG